MQRIFKLKEELIFDPEAEHTADAAQLDDEMRLKLGKMFTEYRDSNELLVKLLEEGRGQEFLFFACAGAAHAHKEFIQFMDGKGETYKRAKESGAFDDEL